MSRMKIRKGAWEKKRMQGVKKGKKNKNTNLHSFITKWRKEGGRKEG